MPAPVRAVPGALPGPVGRHRLPPRPRVPALFGDVVHDALDTIVRALTATGCESARSAEAVAALRTLGGYTAIIEAAVKRRLAGLAGNPRVSDDLRKRIHRDLHSQVADARFQVQAYITALVLGPGRKAAPAAHDAPAGMPGTCRVRADARPWAPGRTPRSRSGRRARA